MTQSIVSDVLVAFQFQPLSFLFFCAGFFPEDFLVIKITVPGVAEDFPLISEGDLVRLFFRPSAEELSTEVVGEVVDVVVKTEVVTIRLPSPMQQQNGRPCSTPGCLPYMRALAHTKNYFLDAERVMTSPEPHEPRQIEDSVRSAVMDKFRFDIRFGFQGGRGFDIIQSVMSEFFQTAPPPKTMTNKGLKMLMRELADPQALKELHLHRLLAPTRKLLGGIVLARDRQSNIEKGGYETLKLVNPVNQEDGYPRSNKYI